MGAPTLYKCSEWESNGYWHVNDTSDLSSVRCKWWVPARLLGMEPAEYIKWLIAKYSPDKISWDGKTLLFSWSGQNYSKAHAYLLYLNKASREKKFYI